MRFTWWLVFVACSSHPGTPAPPGPVAPVVDAAVATQPSGPSEAECGDLFAHVIELQLAEASQPLPADERASIERDLRAQYLAECRATTLAQHRCALAATTPAAVAGCQRTPSSSTSNSNVAPPGITPAAPRSP